MSSWYYTVDPELKLIHAFRNCRAAKMAIKFSYGIDFHMQTETDADHLDTLIGTYGYRVCHPCWKREQGLSQKDHRPVRPGFRKEPRR